MEKKFKSLEVLEDKQEKTVEPLLIPQFHNSLQVFLSLPYYLRRETRLTLKA